MKNIVNMFVTFDLGLDLREFEVQAMRIVNGVHGWQASCDLIEKRHVIWGGKDSLDMAAAAECKVPRGQRIGTRRIGHEMK